MAIQKRPYQAWFDGTADITIPLQGDDPANLQFIPIATKNTITVSDVNGQTYQVASLATQAQNAKTILWSSEGFSKNGVATPAVAAAAKRVTGTSAAIDFSLVHSLSLIVVFTSFTAGTSPTIQFELDLLDDVATPTVLPIWKPTALSAAGNYFVMAGPGTAFAQAAAAPTAPMTGFQAMVVPAGWLYASLPVNLLPQGQVSWTVTGAPTGIAWSAILYGSM